MASTVSGVSASVRRAISMASSAPAAAQQHFDQRQASFGVGSRHAGREMFRRGNGISGFNEQPHQPGNGRKVIGIVLKRFAQQIDGFVAKA